MKALDAVVSSRPGSPVRAPNGTFWSNPSVKTLLTEALTGEGPEDVIRRKARDLVATALELNWEGPPFNPETLASLLGLELAVADEPIGSEARIFPKQNGTVRIEYDPSFPRTRTNFSICHEIVHTFFPDCYEQVRCRNKSTPHERKHQELESLCDLGAAELLMPFGPFGRDLNTELVTLPAILALAEQYGASIEATAIRSAQLGETAFCTVILSEKLKPSELRALRTPSLRLGVDRIRPKLRVDYPSASKHFNVFIPKDKSAPADSVAYRALTAPGVASGRETWDVPGLGLRQVQAVALPTLSSVRRAAVFFSDAT